MTVLDMIRPKSANVLGSSKILSNRANRKRSRQMFLDKGPYVESRTTELTLGGFNPNLDVIAKHTC
jgi:hypothetical protein